jgi:hypothetical protein
MPPTGMRLAWAKRAVCSSNPVQITLAKLWADTTSCGTALVEC